MTNCRPRTRSSPGATVGMTVTVVFAANVNEFAFSRLGAFIAIEDCFMLFDTFNIDYHC